MKRNTHPIGWLLGVSLIAFAQPSGGSALGVAISKDGVRAVSLRLASPNNPTLNLSLIAGTEAGVGITGGLAVQQYLNYGGACGGGACVRGGIQIAPYLEGGIRFRKSSENPQMDILGHLGLGGLVPLSRIELFAQGNLYTLLSPAKPLIDIVGGLRWRF
ncbi:MAG: hypothetical protein NZZ60_04350 [Bacteroidia bacterium]|nr:hypothetical protein [Bacteroidia bacterium]MCX7651361.1 hypothetical protein [Bacteroidia bacterium]MDW8416739.1 hypothetical protein [Bacteroidia bacterium]